MTEIVMIIMVTMLVLLTLFFLLFWLIKTAAHLWEIKNCVDVDIYRFGDSFMKRASYNCVKKTKYEGKTKLDNYELKQFMGKKEFPYDQKFAFTRERDGKTVMCFVEVEGKLVPFIPGTYITGEVDKFTKKEMDQIVERTIIEGYECFVKNATGKKSGLNWLAILLIAAAAALLIGLIVWQVSKGHTNGGGGVVANTVKGALG